MTATIEQLRDDLRATAAKTRTQMFENSQKLNTPAEVLSDLSSVLAELRDTLRGLPARMALPSGGIDGAESAEFVVTERDAEGKVKSFTDGAMNFVVTERDAEGKVKAFKVGS